MTFAKLQADILANKGNTILSEQSWDMGAVLAATYDTLFKYETSPVKRELIISVFGYNKPFYWRGVQSGHETMSELLHRGKIFIDRDLRASEVWESVQNLLKSITPDGFTFKTVENSVGWFEDMEELTLHHTRTWMHNQSPMHGFNKHKAKDALYLLDTLYAWRAKDIPVPQKHIDLLQLIVDTHGLGDGL